MTRDTGVDASMGYRVVGGMMLLLVLLSWIQPATAADKEAGKGKTVPVTVQSDHLDIWEKKQQALFTGRVHLVRGDFELYSDSLLVFYLSAKQGGGIDHALATGHVRMIQADKKGTSDSAVIDNRKHQVTLRGHAVMEQAGGRVAGETIVHDTQTKTTQVFQGKDGDRVSLRINEKQANGNSMLGSESGAGSSSSAGDKAVQSATQEPSDKQPTTEGQEMVAPSDAETAKPAATNSGTGTQP